MASTPRPPSAHDRFVATFPALGQAWEAARAAEAAGPLDGRQQRLLKLAVAIGALRQGAVHSAVRKAVAAGASREEILQVVALAASTIGLPGAVAAFTWVEDVLDS